ncbi:hypothetical protein QTN25_004347 [Entamoeba marina]
MIKYLICGAVYTLLGLTRAVTTLSLSPAVHHPLAIGVLTIVSGLSMVFSSIMTIVSFARKNYNAGALSMCLYIIILLFLVCQAMVCAVDYTVLKMDKIGVDELQVIEEQFDCCGWKSKRTNCISEIGRLLNQNCYDVVGKDVTEMFGVDTFVSIILLLFTAFSVIDDKFEIGKLGKMSLCELCGLDQQKPKEGLNEMGTTSGIGRPGEMGYYQGMAGFPIHYQSEHFGGFDICNDNVGYLINYNADDVSVNNVSIPQYSKYEISPNSILKIGTSHFFVSHGPLPINAQSVVDSYFSKISFNSLHPTSISDGLSEQTTNQLMEGEKIWFKSWLF